MPKLRARTAPFYGRGTGLQFRLNEATGGVRVTDGISDSVSVVLQYLMERWSIREDTGAKVNHIAEAIFHILLTRPTEHDTLPEFGSFIYNILFEPNSIEFQLAVSHWMKNSTIRWEKRARIPEEDAIAFQFNGPHVDQGRLPMLARVEFILEQIQGNLVAPFVTPRQARLQEYRSGELDRSGHDYESRYFGSRRHERAGITFNRFPRIQKLLPADDDQWYTVKPADTWLLISWNLYGDIRYWSYLARMYVTDAAEAGMTRHSIDPSSIPETGTLLRVPSKTRMAMEISTLRN